MQIYQGNFNNEYKLAYFSLPNLRFLISPLIIINITEVIIIGFNFNINAKPEYQKTTNKVRHLNKKIMEIFFWRI